MLQQWKEPCKAGEVSKDCAIVDTNPQQSQNPIQEETISNGWEGRFTLWLVGPMLHIVAAGVTILTTDSTYVWKFVSGWNLTIAYGVFLWFHEFFVGGPHETDNLFSNFNLINWTSFLVNIGITGYAGYKDDTYPEAYITNIICSVVGITFSILTDRWYQNLDQAAERQKTVPPAAGANL